MNKPFKLSVIFWVLLSFFLLTSSVVYAQDETQITGYLTGGHTNTYPVELKQGEVLYIILARADDNLAIFIKNPSGQETNNSSAQIPHCVFQAQSNGQHSIVLNNTNGMDIRKRYYDFTYSVLPSFEYSNLISSKSPLVLSIPAPITSSTNSNVILPAQNDNVPSPPSSSNISGLTIIGIIIGMIVLLIFLVGIGSRSRRVRYHGDSGDTYIIVNGRRQGRRQRSDIQRALDWHVPKVNKDGAEFLSGASSLKKTQQDELKRIRKNLWG
jgi:hypothetical protein